ncbi:MAG: hypothetical protein ACR2GZ_08460 [Solirubrobacteraceae bacterium]
MARTMMEKERIAAAIAAVLGVSKQTAQAHYGGLTEVFGLRDHRGPS